MASAGLATLLVAASWSTAHALPGNVLGEQKISSTSGGFSGVLDNGDFFGVAIAYVGDVNGDLTDDLVVGADMDDDGGSDKGAVWVLFMNDAGSVISQAKISATAGGLTGPLDNDDEFGFAATGIGDLDGDTVPDVAVGAPFDDDGGTDKGAVYILLLNSNGTVKSQQKISATAGGFGGALDNSDHFGTAVANLGDLDGDGVTDLAIGAAGDDDGGTDRGAAWIVFLNSNGTVKSQAKISDSSPNFAGSLSDSDDFGMAAGGLGDLDGDGVEDVAVGALSDPDGGPARGAVWIIFLNTNGSVKASQKISDLAGGFTGTLDDSDMFGTSVAVIPDLDGDGVDDLAVGAVGDDQGGPDRGQIWILFMNTNGTVKSFRRINIGTSGFAGPLADGDFFGSAAVSPRDLDGDGIADLVVGARRDDSGGSNRGAAYVLFLDGVIGALCGDTILDPGEDCDDGNTTNGDCCNSSCQFESNGASCTDNNVCNGNEICNGAGSCLPGAPLDCDDGQACTQDTCDPIGGCSSTTGPALACLVAGKGTIVLADKTPDTKDKLVWKWVRGEETLLSDFGDPTGSDSYTLCVYDTVADNPSLKAELTVSGGLGWVPTSNKGFKFKDSTGANAGVITLLLRAGAANKAKVTLKSKGSALGAELPGPAGATYFDQDSSVIVQLINSLGMCWSSEYATPAVKHDPQNFKDKFP